MFVPTLMGQGTPEQGAHWISQAWDCRIIGTYAQVCNLIFYTLVRYINKTLMYSRRSLAMEPISELLKQQQHTNQRQNSLF